MKSSILRATLLLICPVLVFCAVTPQQQLSRDIFEELININTADSSGSVTKAAEAMVRRLRDAGFPEEDIHVDGPEERFKNLVVRYRGTGAQRPVLLLAHLDVVEALRSDWSTDPFQFVEKDGYFYGRGTSDDKCSAAVWIANLIQYKREGFLPTRDIIVALTAGEESGLNNGVQWLMQNRRSWMDAEFAFNEGAGGAIRDGKKIANYVQASEKIYQSFKLIAKNPGGHSSVPRKDNAIYGLAKALTGVSEYQFPVRLNEVTKTYFERTAKVETGAIAKAMQTIVRNPADKNAVALLSKEPYLNARLRTTCVATRLEGGHADNALPQTATALINCRLLPDEKREDVIAALKKAAGDPQIEVEPITEARVAPSSPLEPKLIGVIEKTTEELWPGVPVIPVMSTGATDSRVLRQAGIPCYGLSGFFSDVNDEREHGKDERIPVESFFEGQRFLYELVKRVSS